MKNAKRDVDHYIGQFPHDQPCPYDLIAKMVKFRVDENNKAHMQQNTKS